VGDARRDHLLFVGVFHLCVEEVQSHRLWEVIELKQRHKNRMGNG
jgi:hypothetical protein